MALGPAHYRRPLVLVALLAIAGVAWVLWPRRSDTPESRALAHLWSRNARAELAVVADEKLFGPCDVVEYVDGDTVHVQCGEQLTRVRLLNIDTPEPSVKVAHRQATDGLRELVAGRPLKLAFELPGTPTWDRYGRLLAYAYADEQNLNLEMIRRGWSQYFTKYGLGRFPRAFTEAELVASKTQLGLWHHGCWTTEERMRLDDGTLAVPGIDKMERRGGRWVVVPGERADGFSPSPGQCPGIDERRG